MTEGLILVAYLAIAALSYVTLSWLFRRWIDPQGEWRELPMPWFFSWPILLISLFAPGFLVWCASKIIHLFL